MKKTIFLIATFLGLCLGANAQNEIKVNDGPEYKDPSRTYISDLIGEDETGIYTLRYKSIGKDQLFLEKYDQQMNLIFTNEILLPPPPTKSTYNIESVLYLKKKFYIFFSHYNKETDLKTLYAGFLDQTGGVNPQMFELSKIESTSKRNSGDFTVSMSRDSSKICVRKDEKYEKNETEKFGFSVFDLDMKLLWSRDVELPYKDKNYHIGKSIVDKDGNIHMFSSVYVPRKEREKGDPDTYYEVFSYFWKDAAVKQYEISLGDNVISGLDIRLDDKNNLIGAGFYSEKREYKMKGTFFFTIDPATRLVKSTSQQEFTKEFLTQFMSEKKAEKGKELANFVIRNIVTRDDGGALIVAEYYLKVVTHYTNPKTGQTRTTTRWYYNDMIVVNINPNGSVAWFSKIPKRQYTAVTTVGYSAASDYHARYLGVSTLVVGDKIYVIFNENPKNLAPTADPTKKPKVMTNPRKSITTLVTLSGDGQLQKVALFPAKDVKSIITPKFYLQLSKNALLMYGDKGKTYRFVKISF